MWVLSTTRGGKVIAGTQLMVDALVVALPQLLLDRALARIRPVRRWTNSPPPPSASHHPEDPARRGREKIRQLTGHDDTDVDDDLDSKDRWGRTRTVREAKMIPDTEAVCQASEVAVYGGGACDKIKDRPEKEAASVTAWKRYQRLASLMESRGGGEFNRKSLIEAIFRGSDLVYANH